MAGHLDLQMGDAAELRRAAERVEAAARTPAVLGAPWEADGQMTPPVSVAASILAEGRQAHVAIDTSSGPHVTPQLYAWSGGRLWFAAASTTRKAAVISDRSRAAAVVSVPGRSVVLAGPVTVLDPRKPTVMVRRLWDAPAAVRAWLGFTARNAADLAGFAGDTLRGRLGWRLPPARVVYSVAPDHLAAVENDVVVSSRGWRTVDETPAALCSVGGKPAVLTMPGPVAAPGHWLVDDNVAVVAPAVASLLGIAGRGGPVAVVVDRYNATGPAAKEGALVRGHASPLGAGRFRVRPERIVEWRGVEVTSRSPGTHTHS